MSHNNLINYYNTIYRLKTQNLFQVSIEEFESLPIFERDIYMDMVLADLEKNKASQGQQW